MGKESLDWKKGKSANWCTSEDKFYSAFKFEFLAWIRMETGDMRKDDLCVCDL